MISGDDFFFTDRSLHFEESPLPGMTSSDNLFLLEITFNLGRKLVLKIPILGPGFGMSIAWPVSEVTARYWFREISLKLFISYRLTLPTKLSKSIFEKYL